jgi:hypothetical protein
MVLNTINKQGTYTHKRISKQNYHKHIILYYTHYTVIVLNAVYMYDTVETRYKEIPHSESLRVVSKLL